MSAAISLVLWLYLSHTSLELYSAFDSMCKVSVFFNISSSIMCMHSGVGFYYFIIFILIKTT